MSRGLAAGFSALELLVVLAIAGGLAAISLPASANMVDEFRLSGDAHGVSNSVALARMDAAANFTRARVFVDLAANTFRIERWNKTANAWQATSGTSPLSSLDVFGSGAIAAPPPNSQEIVAEPPACLDAAAAAIANTACVLFNSRGLPIDNTGAPAATAVFYLTGPTAVYGVVVSSTSQLALWRIPPGGDTWAQR